MHLTRRVWSSLTRSGQASQPNGGGRVSESPPPAHSRVPLHAGPPACAADLNRRSVRAGASSSLGARLKAWLFRSQPANAEAATSAARKKSKLLGEVARVSEQFNAKHGYTRGGVDRDLGKVLQSWRRAHAAGCSIGEIAAGVSMPNVLLRADNAQRLLTQAKGDDMAAEVLGAMRTERAKRCDLLCGPVLQALGAFAPRMVGAASLLALYGTPSRLFDVLGFRAWGALMLAFEKVAPNGVSFEQFLFAMNYSTDGLVRRASLEAQMTADWGEQHPTEAASERQERALQKVRECFDHLEFSVDKGAYFVHGHALEGVDQAVRAAKEVGVSNVAIVKAFLRRPLSDAQCATLRHILSHPEYHDVQLWPVHLARELLAESIVARSTCAQQALAAARGSA